MRSIFGTLITIAILALWLFYSFQSEKPLEFERVPAQKATKNILSPNQSNRAVARAPISNNDRRVKKSNGLIPEEVVQESRRIAKTELLYVSTYQQAYFAEYGRYSTDLKAMGWAPRNTGVAFKLRFLSPFYPPSYNDDGNLFREDPRRMTSDDIIGDIPYDRTEPFEYLAAVNNISLSDFSHHCRRGCTADGQSFEVLLASPIGDSGRTDVWLVNETKEIVLVRDGLAAE